MLQWQLNKECHQMANEIPMDGENAAEMEEMPAEEEAEGEGNPIADMAAGVFKALSTLKSFMVATKGAPPEATQLMDSAIQNFQESLSMMAGGSQPEAIPGEEILKADNAKAVSGSQPMPQTMQNY